MAAGLAGGGALEKYLGVNSLKPFIDMDLVLEGLVSFRLKEVEGLEKGVKGNTTALGSSRASPEAAGAVPRRWTLALPRRRFRSCPF